MSDLPDTDGKNLVELLDMLKPIPEPAPISMWPATEGWIWLALLLLALAATVGWWTHRRWAANAYRRAALAELAAAQDDPAAIAGILRRAALVAYPRRQVAALLGPDWLGFLDDTCRDSGFSSAAGAALVRAPYREEPTNPDLTRLARGWLKTHRSETRA